jgi:hypothetical protein
MTLRWRRFLGWSAGLSLAACSVQPVASDGRTWADYSLMDRPASGVLWADGQPASKFEWVPVTATESHVLWGDPAQWPPTYRERFIRRGDWVMLDGWWGNGTYYQLHMDQESICSADCTGCQPLPAGRGQHYALWKAPLAGYCLRVQGRIIAESGAGTVRFAHDQVYVPDLPCSNAHVPQAKCLMQRETWSDDNGSAYSLKLDRVSFLAAGLGPGFAIFQILPTVWRAELRPGGLPSRGAK